MLPAIRMLKISPNPWSNINSAEVRESIQLNYSSKWKLTCSCFIYLRQEISVGLNVIDEAFIPFFQNLQGQFRRQLLKGFFSMPSHLKRCL